MEEKLEWKEIADLTDGAKIILVLQKFSKNSYANIMRGPFLC